MIRFIIRDRKQKHYLIGKSQLIKGLYVLGYKREKHMQGGLSLEIPTRLIARIIVKRYHEQSKALYYSHKHKVKL